MKCHALFVIFEKAAKILIVVCCKLYIYRLRVKSSRRFHKNLDLSFDPFKLNGCISRRSSIPILGVLGGISHFFSKF